MGVTQAGRRRPLLGTDNQIKVFTIKWSLKETFSFKLCLQIIQPRDGVLSTLIEFGKHLDLETWEFYKSQRTNTIVRGVSGRRKFSL